MELSRARERLLRRIGTRRGREREGVVLLEGPRVLGTAIAAGARLRFLVVEEGAPEEVLEMAAGTGAEVVLVPSPAFAEFADTESPQRLLAVAEEPSAELPSPERARGERCLVLDAVQDPGNLGTLVRSAAAFGLSRCLVLDGSVDPWNPKAVRAAAGTSFRLPLHSLPWPEAASWLDGAGVTLIAADAGGDDVREWVSGGGAPGGWALAVGNEGAGLRAELQAAADVRLALPIANGVESLNAGVAGSILLWALAGQGPGAESRGTPPLTS